MEPLCQKTVCPNTGGPRPGTNRVGRIISHHDLVRLHKTTSLLGYCGCWTRWIFGLVENVSNDLIRHESWEWNFHLQRQYISEHQPGKQILLLSCLVVSWEHLVGPLCETEFGTRRTWFGLIHQGFSSRDRIKNHLVILFYYLWLRFLSHLSTWHPSGHPRRLTIILQYNETSS